MIFKNRAPLATWFHLIQTVRATGHSKVLATVCNRPSLEKIQVSLENFHQYKNQATLYKYTIDPAPVYEPNRRCDSCNCS
jgi:hypothetical protein